MTSRGKTVDSGHTRRTQRSTQSKMQRRSHEAAINEHVRRAVDGHFSARRQKKMLQPLQHRGEKCAHLTEVVANGLVLLFLLPYSLQRKLCSFDGVPLLFEEMADHTNRFHVCIGVYAAPRAILLRMERIELLLPVPQDVGFLVHFFADFANGVAI